MKTINIRIDYTDYDGSGKEIYFFLNENVIHKTCLVKEDSDGETSTLDKPDVLIVTLEIPDDADIVMSLEREQINEPYITETLDLILSNFLMSIGSLLFTEKGHFDSYFLQSCYWVAKRYRFIFESDSSFDLKLKYQTKECPICNMECINSSGGVIEEYYRPCNFEEDYKMYKKSVVWNSLILLFFAGVCTLLGWWFELLRSMTVATVLLLGSSVVFFFRNMIVSKVQYRKLKKNNFDLGTFCK